MGRKVSVALEADVAGFIKGVLGADKAVDDLGDKVEKLDKELDKIPPDAAKAGAALKLLGGDVNSVGDKVSTLGEKNQGLAVLDAKIKQTRSEVKKLADEFVKTGDIDVFKKLGDAQGRLAGLQNVRKKLADALTPDNLVKDGEKAAEGFFRGILNKADDFGDDLAKMLPSALSGALSTPVLGPVIAAGLLAALLAAVDIVLASAGGLVLAAGAGGAIGLGIMGAIMGNPEVIKARWKTAIDGIKQEFVNDAQPFQQPLIDAAAQVQAAFGSMHLEQTFAKAATYLQPLVDGGLEFARYIGQAVNYLTENAGPEVKVIAEELPKIGQAIAEASKSISEGSEGGAQALKDLFGVIETVIAGLGGMIGFAEKAYEKLAKFRDAVIPRDWLFPPDTPQRLDNAARALGGVGDVAKSTTKDLEALSSEIPDAASQMDRWAEKMVDHVFGALMAVDQATLGFAESLTRLDESFEKNGKSIDIHTAKGQANREAVLASIQMNMQAYKSNIDLGMSAEEAAQKYDEGTASIEAQLRKMGVAKGDIDDLIGKYRGIPKRVDTDIAINGLSHAIDNLNETLRLLAGLHDKTVTVYYRTRGQSLNAPLAHGGIRRAASGMIIPPSDPGTTLVGEPQTGGEALIPLRGISQGRAMSLAQTVGDAYGFGVSTGRSSQPLALSIGFSGNASDPVAAMFQRLVYDQKVQLYVNGQRVKASRS